MPPIIRLPFEFVAPVNIEEISNSFLFKKQNDIKLINGAIDFSLFNDKRRDIAKKAINISDTQKVILSGAFYIPDPRKGFKELQKTLALLNDILDKNSSYKYSAFSLDLHIFSILSIGESSNNS